MQFRRIWNVGLSTLLCAGLTSTIASAATFRMVIQSPPEVGGKCLDVPNHQFVPGARLQMWDCNNTVGQTFSYDEASQELKIGNLCVESRGRGDAQDIVGLGSCNGGANQHWRIVASGDYYRIVGTKDLCVDIKGADKANGTSLEIENCPGRQNQLWALVEAPAAFTEQAPPALYSVITAKANDVKEANNTYLKAKCDGVSTKQLEAARSMRDDSRDQLSTLIASDVSQVPEVQGAVVAATAAGEDAAKTAADPKASDQEKAAAQAKFQIAKSYLSEVTKTARVRIELKLKEDTGVTLAATKDECPEDTSKRVEHREPKEPKKPKRAQASSSEPRSSQSSAPPSSGIPLGIGIGGISIGGGGGGISIGR